MPGVSDSISEEVVKLRRQGKSYRSISAETGVAKSSLSYFFKGLSWSEEIKERLTEEARVRSRDAIPVLTAKRTLYYQGKRNQYREEAERDFEYLVGDPLFIAGIMLYWAEGDNKMGSYNVRLGNTDWRIVKIFVDFAKYICKVPILDIRPTLILYNDLNERMCKEFWSRKIDIPKKQFYKTQYILGRHKTRRLENGICTVRIGGIGLKEKMKVWIDRYALEIHARVAQR